MPKVSFVHFLLSLRSHSHYTDEKNETKEARSVAENYILESEPLEI